MTPTIPHCVNLEGEIGTPAEDMDQQIIRGGNLVQTAETLQSLLMEYAPQSTAVRGLQKALKPLLDDAVAGRIVTPMDWNAIPGARTFEETEARTLPGLESAYASFKFAITGGEPDWVNALRQRRGY